MRPLAVGATAGAVVGLALFLFATLGGGFAAIGIHGAVGMLALAFIGGGAFLGAVGALLTGLGRLEDPPVVQDRSVPRKASGMARFLRWVLLVLVLGLGLWWFLATR